MESNRVRSYTKPLVNGEKHQKYAAIAQDMTEPAYCQVSECTV